MVIEYDFSDVDSFFELGWKELRDEVESIAKEAVEEAVKTGNYKNWTWKLRKGNKYKVSPLASLELWNEMFYAPYVEAKGYKVLSDVFWDALDELKKRIQ